MPDDRTRGSEGSRRRPGLWPCGVIGAPHGLDGRSHLRLVPDGSRCLLAGTRFFVSRGGHDDPEPVQFEMAGGSLHRPLVRVADADTREAAATWTGCLLLSGGGELDEAPHHVVGELIGLRAVSGGDDIGVVVDVLQGVAHDILALRAEAGGEVLVPLVDELIEVDLDAGLVRVREGLLG